MMKIPIVTKFFKGKPDAGTSIYEPGFIDLARENLFLRRLALGGCAAFCVMGGSLVYTWNFWDAKVYFVSGTGEARALSSGDRTPREIERYLASVLTNAYESRPWPQKIQESNANIPGYPSDPTGFRLFAASKGEAKEGENSQIEAIFEGIRLLGRVDGGPVEHEPIRLTAKIKKTDRTDENPYGLEIIELIENPIDSR